MKPSNTSNNFQSPCVELIRFRQSDHGSFGVLLIDGVFFCYTIEPPQRNNLPNFSCIPAGEYKVVWHRSPRYGWVYMVTQVDGRAFVLTHPGNYGGDIKKGFKTHTQGCILLGSRLGVLGSQRAVLNSRPTVHRFFSKMNKQPFNLIIKESA